MARPATTTSSCGTETPWSESFQWSTGPFGADLHDPVKLDSLAFSSNAPGFSGTIYWDEVKVYKRDVGLAYCTSTPNSSGGAASISATGSPFTSDAELVLSAAPVPASVPGIFYYGSTQTQTPFGSGFRCVDNPALRLPVTQASGNVLDYTVNFGAPQAAGIQPGATLSFQAWFRDPVDAFGFQLSDGLEITFL